MTPKHGAPTAGVTLAGSLALLILPAACGDSGPAPNGWTAAVDTLPNGAVHVQYTPPADPAPTWRLEPELRIGAVDGQGPEVFGRIRDIAVMPDGRIVVLDGQAKELRVFSPEGEHLATWGRQGGGPGEFRMPYGAVPGPDGLVRVPDALNDRLSFVDPDSGVVRSHVYKPLGSRYTWDGVVDSVGQAWSYHYTPGNGAGPGRLFYAGYDPQGHPLPDTLPYPRQLPGPGDDMPGAWLMTLPGGEQIGIGNPYYASQRTVLSPRLRNWITREGDPAYELLRLDPALDTTLVLSVGRPTPVVDPAAVDSFVAGWKRRAGVTLDRSRIPEHSPAIASFFFDDDGRLWVHLATPDSLHVFDAFDADEGAYLGTLSTDLNLSDTPPPTIRGQTLWGLVRDELGVEYVVRARLVGVGEGKGSR